MTTVRRPGALASGLVAALAAALVLAGCAAADSDDMSDHAPAERDIDSGSGVDDWADPDAGPEETEAGGEAGGAIVDSRAIIFTGEIRLRVDRVDAGASQVAALAERHGGFIGGDRRSGGADDPRATVVLRVPSENFYAAVNDAARLGEELSRDIDPVEVHQEVVDLGTRIATAQASVDRTRDLLERAESIADIVAVEEELAAREARLASLQARERELADLTTLSTITVSLVGPEAPVEEEREPRELGFLPGLDAGWTVFLRAMTVAVTVFGALLPWLVAAAVPSAGVLWWARRRNAPAPS